MFRPDLFATRGLVIAASTLTAVLAAGTLFLAGPAEAIALVVTAAGLVASAAVILYPWVLIARVKRIADLIEETNRLQRDSLAELQRLSARDDHRDSPHHVESAPTNGAAQLKRQGDVWFVECSQCGAQLRVREKHLGRAVQCPRCQTQIAVPVGGGPLSTHPWQDASAKWWST